MKSLQSFFCNNNEQTNNIDIDAFINQLNSYQEKLKSTNNTIADLIDKMFLLTQKDFLNEVEVNLNSSRIFEGINPEMIKNSSGQEVKLYTLQHQTDYQKKLYLLTRTNYIQKYMHQENAIDEYMNDMSKYDYLSYSLINAEQYSGFAQKSRITFGYCSINNNSLMSANTHDGQTNQYHLQDDFYVMKQEYLGLDTFMSKTESYNEIVLKNNEPLKPSCIIINEPFPSEEMIDIASNMNLPIIYMDPQYYKKHEAVNPVTEQERINSWYRHDNYLDYNLSLCVKNNTQNKQ